MASTNFDLSFKVKNLFFDKAAVKAMMDGKTREALSKAGAWVKVTAQRSMRYVTSLGRQQGQMQRGKRTRLYVPVGSGAGEPPHAIRGHSYIRDFLFYSYDPANRSVVVGPVRLPGTVVNVPALHEYGGTQTLKARKVRTFLAGKYGPIRIGGRPCMTSHTVTNARGWPILVTFAKLRSAAQVDAANRIEVDLNTTSAGVKPGETYLARYLPRPFMAPALAAARSSLPQFWATAIQPSAGAGAGAA